MNSSTSIGLRSLADDYQSMDLKDYACRLEEQVDAFDIESLPRTLRQFSEIIETISVEASKT